MSTRSRRISGLTILAVLAFSVSGAALAWACTPQSHLDVGPTSARPGSTIAISGNGFLSGPVQIYWNGDSGPVLATATGPSFTVRVTVPDVAAGIYYPRGVARDAGGNIAGDASKAFQVESPAVRAPAAPRAPTHSGHPRTAPVTGVSPSSASPRHLAAPRQPTATTSPSGAAATATAALPQGPVASSDRTATAAHRPGSVTPASHRPIAHAAATGHGGSRSTQSAGPWAPRPIGSTSASGSSSSPIAIGIGVLALGLVALFGGFAVAEVRRRRAMGLSFTRRR